MIQYVVLTLVAYPVFYEFTSVTFKSLLPLIDTFVAADAAPQTNKKWLWSPFRPTGAKLLNFELGYHMF